jgi:hypothetical protein
VPDNARLCRCVGFIAVARLCLLKRRLGLAAEALGLGSTMGRPKRFAADANRRNHRPHCATAEGL